MSRTSDLLDRFYADFLGCSPGDLNAGRLIVVEHDPGPIRFAKGAPLALYSVAKLDGAVISTRPEHRRAVEQALCASNAMDDAAQDAIEKTLSPLISVRFWFRGARLFCEPDTFVDRTTGEVREISPDEDQQALALHRMWGGKVFGQIVGGQAVSWAAVKPLSNVVWDLSIDTLPEHRRRGYAKSAVSAALKYIFANDRLAGWGCDRTSAASLRTAESVGFRPYALDFGCVEASPNGSDTIDLEQT